jgi:hypothetical protein
MPTSQSLDEQKIPKTHYIPENDFWKELPLVIKI